jgi:hypothetical protein
LGRITSPAPFIIKEPVYLRAGEFDDLLYGVFGFEGIEPVEGIGGIDFILWMKNWWEVSKAWPLPGWA